MRGLTLLALGVLLIAACHGDGGGSPTEPSNPLTGSWGGTYSGRNHTTGAPLSGTLSMSLVQGGPLVTGNGTQCDSFGCTSGTINGSVSGNGIVFTAAPSDPRLCPYRATGTWSNSLIHADWVSFSCSASLSGSLDVTKQ